jgi:thioester reductase-like protein
MSYFVTGAAGFIGRFLDDLRARAEQAADLVVEAIVYKPQIAFAQITHIHW